MSLTDLPNKLRLIDGELVCVDGSDVREYLRDYAIRAKVTSETKIVLMQRNDVAELQHAAYMMKGWAA